MRQRRSGGSNHRGDCCKEAQEFKEEEIVLGPQMDLKKKSSRRVFHFAEITCHGGQGAIPQHFANDPRKSGGIIDADWAKHYMTLHVGVHILVHVYPL